MRASFFILAFLGSLSIFGYGQQSDSLTRKQISIEELGNDMKRLVELNAPIKNGTDFSTVESIHLNHATVDQIIEVTDPYLNSTIPNSKHLCEFLLMHAVLYQASNELERQELVEVLCKNFLTEESLHFLNNTLLLLRKKDFNDSAKKYVVGLINSLTTYYYGLPAQFLSTAQITKSIPFLWKIVDTSFKTIQNRDIDVLASLARMNEKKAGRLLAEYYNSSFNNWGDFSAKTGEFWRHFLIAKNLAFSLDSTVLNCLIKEFRAIDINYSFRDGDSGFYPAQYLGACIASMIENYPYRKEDYALKPKELLDWLSTNDIQVKDK